MEAQAVVQAKRAADEQCVVDAKRAAEKEREARHAALPPATLDDIRLYLEESADDLVWWELSHGVRIHDVEWADLVKVLEAIGHPKSTTIKRGLLSVTNAWTLERVTWEGEHSSGTSGESFLTSAGVAGAWGSAGHPGDCASRELIAKLSTSTKKRR